ncbi:GNAT family N-acetyltransferase [candidate division KSB1 bacterium]|nr:GNAT family N-acetyltransferase [candidate division KSB1 bacterium]
MKIIPYKKNIRKEWDQFVEQSNNGTIFHSHQFLDYHAPGKFQFNNLVFMEGDRILAVLPGRLKDGIYESPIGASYGSIVTKDISFAKSMDLVSSFLKYARKSHIREIVLTAPPLIYEKHPNQNLEYAMLWQGFEYKTHYISSAIHLDPDREIIPRFQKTVRYYVRKSLKDKNIRVELNEDYDAFYPILLHNLSRHNVRPTHSLEELIRLKELLPDALKLFMVYHKDDPIGGCLMFYCNQQVGLCFYNMMYYEAAQHRPIHRVLYEVVKYSTEKGFKYVDIGVSQDTAALNPMTPNESLIAYKETFDAKACMRNTLAISL